MKSSVSKQIQDLVMVDSMFKNGSFKPILRGAVILLVVLLALGVYTRLPPYFMIAAFVGLFIFATRRTSPHLSNAVKALAEGQKKTGLVKIAKVYDSDNCNAVVTDPTLGIWRFTFIPTGWKPSQGEFPATIYHLPEVAWPVLVEVEDGIMVPREKPDRSPK